MKGLKFLPILLAMTATAAAQVSDIEVPTIVTDTTTTTTGEQTDDELDIANIVQSAAKSLTTVQEAPAIVTVITADEIKDRHMRGILELIDTVPGWLRIGAYHNMFPIPLARGQVQAVQFLNDGLSLFDSMVNMPTITRQQPMELVKRVEMITGPGGVLWGSNSLLGILNVITKDAEDVDGIEVGSQVGHGDGDRMAARAYVMAGKPDIKDGKVSLFGHASVDTFQGAKYRMPQLIFHQPLPQPNSPNTYGPMIASDQPQSMIVNLTGKARVGNLYLRASYPFGEYQKGLALSGNPITQTPPEGLDDQKATVENQWLAADRYLVAEYRSRFADSKAGIAVRVFGHEFYRSLEPLAVLTPSVPIQGGLAFGTDMTNYRLGGAFDGDIEAGKKARVLYGAEVFTDWLPNQHDGDSRQGDGSLSTFASPYDLTRLPLPCPRQFNQETQLIEPVPGCPLTFTFQSQRTVMGAYVSPQVRPTKKLILDAGARVQVSPEELGTLGYPVNFTAAGTLVYNFLPGWHVKLNYAQGFRPPVFNNTSSNGEAIQFGGNPDLSVETSEAMQAEVNARIFKGERRIRELSFRIDGSYTRLSNLIQINAGSYGNSGDRGISSAEFLGKLYIQGGHRLELAYTWMRVASADRGQFRSLPENWFNFTTVFNVITNKVSATTNLKVVGSMEDPNRLVEYRDTTLLPNGHAMNAVTVNPSDVTLDKLPPIADLSLGVAWTPVEKLLVRATVYNALMQHSYQPDVFFDYEPHAEYMPNPYEGLRAYLSAQYQY
jgi:outer membrane receptor protein involved in Fe transport